MAPALTLLSLQKSHSITLLSTLFVYTNDLPRENALERAKAYFAQGYNINFVSITDLTIHILLSGDEAFRTAYNNRMFELFNAQDVQATIKVAWNDALTEAMQA